MKSPIFLLAIALTLTIFNSNAQTSKLSIQVVDELGEPLPGANIIYENDFGRGIYSGTTTDAAGFFQLKKSDKPEFGQTESIAPDRDNDKDEQDPGSEDPEQEHILVSFLGYESKRLPVKEAAQMSHITLAETVMQLNEVIIEASPCECCSEMRCAFIIFTKERIVRQIDEPTLIINPEVYPNPAQNQLTVEHSANLGSVKIFDYLGKQWADYNFGEVSTATLYINDLPTGNYLIVTEAGDAVKFQKIN